MKYAAFVPFKGKDWHTRLEKILEYEQRRELALRELFHVLSVWGRYADLYVGLQTGGEINPYELKLRLALLALVYDIRMLPRILGMRILQINDVNEGIEVFSSLVSGNGYRGIIISGSDLPLLSVKDVEDLLSSDENVVFSSAQDGGTPAYRIIPPGIYVPKLYVDDGCTNAERQRKNLNMLPISWKEINNRDNNRDGLCRDLDTEEDLKYILANRGNSLPVAYLRSLPTYQNFFEC